MSLIELDFETRSEYDINKVGSMKYLRSKDADIVCLAYKIDFQETKLWVPGNPLPDCVTNIENSSYYAFNALFDYRVWNLLGRKYGFPKIKLKQWIDVMALCGRFTYHQSLEKAGDDLNLKIKKQKNGKALMKKICQPPYRYSNRDLMQFYDYCIADVDSMHEMIQALPASKLTDLEQQIWELTMKINNTGVPVDIPACKQILKVVEAYKLEQNTLLPSYTDNRISKATQTKRITDWVRSKGVTLPNLQAKTVEDTLNQKDLPADVRKVLELRRDLGRSSTAKFVKILDQAYAGKVFDNLRYYGANTGRWAGMGFQLHNLPRSKVVDADPIIESFMDLSVIEDNPVEKAKSIIRGMIKAPKGQALVAADYHAVEYVGLSWATKDYDALERFRNGFDQYIDMASFYYEKPYDDITDDERAFGKMIILGCGYGLGWKGFIKNAEGWGVYLSPTQAKSGVDAYRIKYKKVKSFWYSCAKAAMIAIRNPGKTYTVHDCKFRCIADRNKTRWLQLTLPSGRNLYYNQPIIQDGDFGDEVAAMGINPYTKKWMYLKVIPGRFVENIIQALCRDLLAYGKIKLDEAGYKLIGSVHDEVLVLLTQHGNEPEYCQYHLDNICKIMCKKPAWAKGFPLTAEGFYGKRYRKM